MEQTVYHKPMNFPMGGRAKQPSPEDQLTATRAQAEQTAEKMGEGVTVQAVDQLPPRDGWKAVRIVYAFTDIGQVRVSPLPGLAAGGARMGAGAGGMAGPAAGGAGPEAGGFPSDEQAKQWIRFGFTKEPSPKLTIEMPPMEPPKNETPPMAEQQDPQAQAMAKAVMTQLLDGMLMEFRVKVDGRITDSNASFISSSREVVGILHMDLGGLAKDTAAMDKMTSMNKAATPEEFKKQLQDSQVAKYIKMETQEAVEVGFE